MISTINQLFGTQLPFSKDEELKEYLLSINTAGYDLKMLEKDFYLTWLLGYISQVLPELSFKWWTCLNKVYFPYFRLSEDLDFSMAIDDPVVESNSKRQQFASNMRGVMQHIASTLGRWISADHVQHKKAQWNQYIRHKEYTYLKYELSYMSVFATGTTPETIKIECTYTHKQLLPSKLWTIQNIYTNPVFWDSFFPVASIQCLDLSEMIAEKTRAALTRRVPAIRDFYDLRYVSQQWYSISDYFEMTREKCEDVDNRWTILQFEHQETSHNTKEYLDEIVEKELNPVLVDTSFDLDTIYKQLLHIYHLLSE